MTSERAKEAAKDMHRLHQAYFTDHADRTEAYAEFIDREIAEAVGEARKEIERLRAARDALLADNEQCGRLIEDLTRERDQFAQVSQPYARLQGIREGVAAARAHLGWLQGKLALLDPEQIAAEADEGGSDDE